MACVQGLLTAYGSLLVTCAVYKGLCACTSATNHPPVPTCIISSGLSLTGEGMMEKRRWRSVFPSAGLLLEYEAGLNGDQESLPREERLSERLRVEERGWEGAGNRSKLCIIIKSIRLSSIAFW